MNRFPTTVTFQEPVIERSPAGQVVIDSYDNVTDLTELPARIAPRVEEAAGERMVTTEDLFEIYVEGDRAVRPEMYVLSEAGVFDIKRVANPTLGNPMTLVTVVVAERVAL